MNQRELTLAGIALGVEPPTGAGQTKRSIISHAPVPKTASASPLTVLLNAYVSRYIYRIPVTIIKKAKYPNYDAHSHERGSLSTRKMVETVYEVGVEQSVVFTGTTTFRILGTDDDHFYGSGKVDTANFNFNYHWTLNAFNLSDELLKQITHDNAVNIFKKAGENAA